MDALEDGIRLLLCPPAALHVFVEHAGGVRLTLLGALDLGVEQNNIEAGGRGDECNSRAHHSAAEYPHRRKSGFGHLSGPSRQSGQLSLTDKHRAHDVARYRITQ